MVLKRKKYSHTPELDDLPTRSAKVWFEDGDVILQAGRKVFLVHRNTLMDSATAMLQVGAAQQTGGEPTMDGHPLYLLPDDEVDLEYFLDVLYHP
jgi:hypothetical protein